MSNLSSGNRVNIQYPGKQKQKQTLTLTHKEVFNNKVYWYVKERMCAIPQNILVKVNL